MFKFATQPTRWIIRYWRSARLTERKYERYGVRRGRIGDAAPVCDRGGSSRPPRTPNQHRNESPRQGGAPLAQQRFSPLAAAMMISALRGRCTTASARRFRTGCARPLLIGPRHCYTLLPPRRARRPFSWRRPGAIVSGRVGHCGARDEPIGARFVPMLPCPAMTMELQRLSLKTGGPIHRSRLPWAPFAGACCPGCAARGEGGR